MPAPARQGVDLRYVKLDGMAGLITGIEVRPALDGWRSYADPPVAPRESGRHRLQTFGAVLAERTLHRDGPRPGVNVPVTAKLSKALYDRLGEEVVAELVDWLNLVDATYRSDLRELNEHNFARSDAKLEQRLAQFESKLEQRLAQFESKLEQRLTGFESKVEQRLGAMQSAMKERFAEQDAKLAGLRSDLLSEMHRTLQTQTRFLYAVLAAQLGATIAVALTAFAR